MRKWLSAAFWALALLVGLHDDEGTDEAGAKVYRP